MELSGRQTVIVAILVLYLGRYLTGKIGFLRRYNIPEPVSGGVLASVLFGALYAVVDFEMEFALRLRDVFLVVFFTTIGLSSELRTLIQGGRALVILLGAAVTYLFLQNLTGVGVAALTGIGAAKGIIGGSVSLSGGHGTAIAWAPRFVSEYGVANAMEIGIACATFGLVLGGVIGGPIAEFLIRRNGLESTAEEPMTVGVEYGEHPQIDYDAMLSTILVITVAIGLGMNLDLALDAAGVKLPLFVSCLFAGILLTNTLPFVFRRISWPVGRPSMALVADLSLGFFLAMSLMSLQLWTLVDLAGPILAMLVAQVVVVTLFVTLVVFNLMGRSYDAAVISAGYAGLALGATPTAIANMTAVSKSFGPAPQAFLIVPLVGAFFIDIANAVIIQRMLAWFT